MTKCVVGDSRSALRATGTRGLVLMRRRFGDLYIASVTCAGARISMCILPGPRAKPVADSWHGKIACAGRRAASRKC